MKTVWTQNLETEDEKVKFQTGLLHSKWLLDRQNEILKSLEKGLDRQERSPRSYDQPNWEFRQAHANGYRQCLNDILELNNLDQKDTKTNDRKSISTTRQ